jgi:hypothetical protein
MSMKKFFSTISGILAVLCLSASEVTNNVFSENDQLVIETSMKFKTYDWYRGLQYSLIPSNVFLLSVKIGYQIFDGTEVYNGVDAIIFTKMMKKREGENIENEKNKISPYVGISYDINDVFTLDVDSIHHIYPSRTKEIPNDDHIKIKVKCCSGEIYISVIADVLLTSSL